MDDITAVAKNYVMVNAAPGLAHVDTDHRWSDHRIALESIVITWLAGLH